MKTKTNAILAFTIGLMLCVSVVCAQQPGDDTKIVQMKATIQKLDALAEDENIPPETREQLAELLFEKRGELHSLLRQKRDALRTRLQGNLSPAEANSIARTIQELNQQLQQLMNGASSTLTRREGVQTQEEGTGSDSTASSTGSTSEPLDLSLKSRTADASVPSLTAPAATSAPALRGIGSAPKSPALITNVPSSSAPSSAATFAPASSAPQPDPCANFPSAAADPDVEYQRQIKAATCRIFKALAGAGNAGDAHLNFQAYNVIMALAIARGKLPKAAIAELTAQAENASNSKNLGASDSSSATNLIAKAGVPAIFGFAVENGALTKATSGTTVTFSGNPVGLVQTMAKKGFISAFQDQDDFTKFLRKLSFGLSFDTSRGSQPGTFTGDKQQLSGFSFKYNILDQRDPRDKNNTARWHDITIHQAANLALALNDFVRTIAAGRAPQLEAWLVSANQALNGKTDFNEIQNVLIAELNKLADIKLPADQEALVKQVGTDFDAFIKERNDILNEIANKWIATFDYNNTRPVGTPSFSNFRFLAEKGAYKGSIDFTGNASLTFYNSRPTGPKAQRLRDFKFAGQLDVPIGDVTKTGKFLLSFAGRYERLLNDEPIAGTTSVIKRGDIAVGQLKLTIPIRGTALKIPLSVSFANRTELVKEKEVRGNFGITFDIDSLLAKFNPFTQK